MSSEQNQPEVHVHQGPPPSSEQGGDSFAGSSSTAGSGLSKSSRRRRRKRKTRTDDLPGASVSSEAGAPGMSFVPPAQSAVPAQQAGMGGGASHTPSGGQFQQVPGGGTKRWKKKFRDRDRNRQGGDGFQNNNGANGGAPSGGQNFSRDTNTHQFGNRADGFKRKAGGGSGAGKQQRDRGPRSFVGPMDHSYRVANGNFLEAPPSTIEPNGNGGGGGRARSYHSSFENQPIDYSQGKTVPVAENAPTRIFLFIDELFFIAKINETARKLGVKVAFIKNEKEAVANLLALDGDERPGLIVFDLNNANAKPLTLIPKLKAKFKRSTSVVGFLSHLQGDLKAKATEAGCDTVMPRAAFSQNLPNLLRRYGLEEEVDEGNFNQ